MTKKDITKAVENAIMMNFIGEKVEFEETSFVVQGFEVNARKRTIPKSEWDDYGVDEDTEYFIEVLLMDNEDEDEAMEAVCSLLTVNTRGQLGTASVPYDFDYEDAGFDFAERLCELTDKAL